MKKKKSTIFTILFMIIAAAAILVTYNFMNKKKEETKTESKYVETELDKLLNKDLTKDYPSTPREVIKFYSRIILQIHGSEELTKEQIEGLVNQIRMLYSKELLEENPREEQIQKMNDDILEYKENKRIVTQYQVEKADSGIQTMIEGVEYFQLRAAFSTKENKKTSRVCEQFLLCKEDGKWKIVGWKKVDIAEMDFN